MTGREELWSPPAGSIPTLPVPSLEGIDRVHLIGIGGAGMRNLARLLSARGLEVTGSDLKDSSSLRELASLGVATVVGHDPARLGEPDVVVISSAIADTNPELVAARGRGIEVWRRQQALAALAGERRSIAIAGTHGKTTTTSMVAVVLGEAGLDPTYLIGGDLNESGSGARHGEGDLFVFEADESDGSHLLLRPWAGVVTNIDEDHLDFYPGGIDEIERSFSSFVGRCEHVVACGDDPHVRAALDRVGVAAITYGVDGGNDIRLVVRGLGPEGASGTLLTAGQDDIDLSLRVDGPHNLLNAAAAVAVGGLAGVGTASAAASLGTFTGVHRRFELRGRARGVEVFDDYGHNPTEMAVTIATARRRAPRRVVAMVQPHRYTRVQAMWRELGASVAGADLVVVTDVYGASQAPIPGVTGALVVDGVNLADPQTPTVYLPHRHDLIAFLDRELQEGDLMVTMGCGDVWMIGDAVLARLRAGGQA